MRADNIASHGKTGAVTASTISSLGRLGRLLGEIVGKVYKEVYRGMSYITRALSLRSKIDFLD